MQVPLQVLRMALYPGALLVPLHGLFWEWVSECFDLAGKASPPGVSASSETQTFLSPASHPAQPTCFPTAFLPSFTEMQTPWLWHDSSSLRGWGGGKKEEVWKLT